MSPRKDNKPTFSLDAMLGELAAGIRNPKRNNLQYEPHPMQLPFHASGKKGRHFLGGNRSGKTTGGINEDIWWLTGRHPYLQLPEPPIIGRICTVDFKNGANKIILPNLRQWLAPSDLINGSWEDSYNGADHILTLANRSELEIMSYDQELDKFAGVPRHFIHFDEEPPKDIYKECLARLVDYRGRWWLTMTPVEGMTWTYEEIYQKALDGDPLIDLFEVDIHDNTYLSEEAIDEVMEGYDENEKAIRGKGKYIAVSGLIFKRFDPTFHVISSVVPDPNEYTHYVSLDHGFNNPTAVLFHAVHNTKGHVITYKEWYKKEMTIEQHANQIKAMEAELRAYGILPFVRVADPAIKQRSAVTGLSVQIEYANHGINFALGAVRDVNAGLDKMINYLRLNKWFITEDCPNLQREMRSYKRSQYATQKLRDKNNAKEEPEKKNDHAIDSARYFFSFQPDLDVHAPTPDARVVPNVLGARTITSDYLGSGLNSTYFDTNVSKEPTGSYPVANDEYVGDY